MTKIERIQQSLEKQFGATLPAKLVKQLRYREEQISRFDELLCGSEETIGGRRYDVAIVEAEETGAFEFVRRDARTGREVFRHRIKDVREKALQFATLQLQPFGLKPFHQADPRGCSLYVVRANLPYDEAVRFYPTFGVAIC